MDKSTLKLVFWWLVERLPISISRRILRIILGPDYIDSALWNQRIKLATKLEIDKIVRLSTKIPWNGVILIAGPPRVGKSTLSKHLAEKIGALHVPMDRIRNFYNQLPDRQRLRAKKRLLRKLCRRGKGLVIEGDQLITDDRFDFSKEIHDINISPCLLEELTELPNVTAMFVGNASSNESEKLQGISLSAQNQDCWASKRLKMNELKELTSLIISISKRLSEASTNNKVRYIEIETDTFDNSIIEASNKLIKIAGEV